MMMRGKTKRRKRKSKKIENIEEKYNEDVYEDED